MHVGIASAAVFFRLKLHLYISEQSFAPLPLHHSHTLHTLTCHPTEGLRQGWLGVAVCTTCPLQQSHRAQHIPIYFSRAISNYFPLAQSPKRRNPTSRTGGFRNVQAQRACGSPQSLAHTLRLPSGLDGSSSSSWEEISCQV